MSLRHYVFANEAEAMKCAAEYAGKAKVVYRGDYRRDWLVSVEE